MTILDLINLRKITDKWIGIKYIEGGRNKNGVDCVGLINGIFQEITGDIKEIVDIDKSNPIATINKYYPSKILDSNKLGMIIVYRLHNKFALGLFIGRNQAIIVHPQIGVTYTKYNEYPILVKLLPDIFKLDGIPNTNMNIQQTINNKKQIPSYFVDTRCKGCH